MNHSYIACWKDIQNGIGTEQQQVALIQVSLLSPEQNQWLKGRNLTIEDLLNGRYIAWLEGFVHLFFFKAWNDQLEKNGLERSFSEDINVSQEMITRMEATLGKPVKFV